ncbi:hypothetical protein BpHYR1_015505 [Brachionus plicatilis]|uniref:Uncharacterized protein n=1 Tax=Brachionus plicatilis TaxID=10195 RepID=A0A3M7SKC4_BRAPC|nr:hypothetical protein BpHYR1_015505 [Brachionus plicatilis]
MFSCFIRSPYNLLVTCMLKVKAVCGVSMHISCACALLCDALQQFSGKTFWALVCFSVYLIQFTPILALLLMSIPALIDNGEMMLILLIIIERIRL